MAGKPKVFNSESEKQIDQAEKQLEAFETQVKELTHDRINQMAPKAERESQVELSSKDIENSKDIYLKPNKSIGPGINPKTGVAEKFNEKFRAALEYDKELVYFTAQNNEIIGESLEIWTKPYGGMNAEFWIVPVNTPVWGPRYLAEQIKRKFYHRLKTEDSRIVGSDGRGTYTGQMVVDTTVQRLDAFPVSRRKSVFMGAGSF